MPPNRLTLGQANEQSALELLTLVLKLNNSQQEQLHAAFNAALKEATPISDEMEHAKNQLFAAARSGKERGGDRADVWRTSRAS